MPSAITRHPNTNAPDDHHLAFFEILKAKEREKAAKPTPLSAEEHAANREQLGTVRFVKPKYSVETEINVTGIFGKWTRYVMPYYKPVMGVSANIEDAATVIR